MTSWPFFQKVWVFSSQILLEFQEHPYVSDDLGVVSSGAAVCACAGADGAGALDFAGGTVIHINAGAAAVAAAILVGKRRNPGLQPNNVEEYINSRCTISGFLKADYFYGHKFVINVEPSETEKNHEI